MTNDTTMNQDIFEDAKYLSLFDNTVITIKLNKMITISKIIEKLFKLHNVKLNCYKSIRVPKDFNIHFGCNVSFQNIYIIARTLQQFGVQKIYFIENEYHANSICIGSFITENNSQPKSWGMTIEEVLSLDFSTSTENFHEIILEKRIFEEEDNNTWYDESYDSMDGYGTSYEKYGGFNGFSDDVIDDVFEGDPLLTWNVD